MTLFSRIIGQEDPKIPCHQFQAAMDEWAGKSDNLGSTPGERRQSVINAFNISAAEESELDFLVGLYQDANTNGIVDNFRKVFDNCVMLAENTDVSGALGYDTEASIVARLQAASSPPA